MTLSDTTLVKRKDTVLSTKLEDEYVMMNIESGEYFSLKNVAAKIWDLIEDEKSVADVKVDLMKAYDIDAQTCDAEVAAFLNDIVSADIADVK